MNFKNKTYQCSTNIEHWAIDCSVSKKSAVADDIAILKNKS